MRANLLTSYLLLFSALQGTETVNVNLYDDSQIFDKYKIKQQQKRNFSKDFMGMKIGTNVPRPNARLCVDFDNILGEDDSCKILGGFALRNNTGCQDANKRYVVKYSYKCHGDADIINEINTSQKIKKRLLKKLSAKSPNYGYLQGASAIVHVAGKMNDKDRPAWFPQDYGQLLVQERIPGKDVEFTIFNKFAPYESGAPRDLQEGLIRVANLLSGFIALHEVGFVHCDLKLNNIMIENDSSLCYPCKIIDLGSARKAGERILDTNFSAAPETFDETGATSACDMYAIGTVLPYLLFGVFSESSSRYFYQRLHDFTIEKSQFEQELYVFLKEYSNKTTRDFFIKKFRKYNHAMYEATGRAYPHTVLIRLATLTAKMLSDNPEERPSATDAFEEFIDMGLADWEHGFYSIQKEKEPRLQRRNSFIPFSPKPSSSKKKTNPNLTRTNSVYQTPSKKLRS